MELTAILFCCVYLALAVGHLPGFRLDRTGAVVVGAMLLITLGRITPEAAWHAVDYRTIGLLFGLMVMSSAFSVAGFYRWVAARVGSLNVKPAMLLALLIAVTGALSALLTNDVVAVAMTPMLISICLVRGLNPVPFVLGFCFATNIGGAATLIGSPQNMVVAEMLDLSFTQFTRATALPALLGLPVIWGVVVMIYRGRWHLPGVEAARGAAASAAAPAVGASMSSETAQTPPAAPAPAPVVIHLDVPAAVKASLVTTAVIVAFIFTDWPHVLIALGGASLLLISRHVESRDLLREVDGSLLLLLMGLFIVNMAMSSTGLPQQLIAYARNAG
ncbi:MAG: hypothetical protein LBE59_09665, partial [Nevskiaceae bacterium]|nr:hypothetical protein [Nevskiaceae bacterium]